MLIVPIEQARLGHVLRILGFTIGSAENQAFGDRYHRTKTRMVQLPLELKSLFTSILVDVGLLDLFS